jgi:hypothetical protein
MVLYLGTIRGGGGVCGQRQAPPRLKPGERNAGTNLTGGWVGPRAGLYAQSKKNLYPAADRNLVVQPTV